MEAEAASGGRRRLSAGGVAQAIGGMHLPEAVALHHVCTRKGLPGSLAERAKLGQTAGLAAAGGMARNPIKMRRRRRLK